MKLLAYNSTGGFIIRRILPVLILLLIESPPLLSQQKSININNIKKSKTITAQALNEINRNQLRKAYDLVKKAVILDPSNNRAKELYIRLNELFGGNYKRIKSKDGNFKIKNEVKRDVLSTIVIPDKYDAALKKLHQEEKFIENLDTIILKMTGTVSFSDSEYLNHVDSSLVMGGIAIGGVYYLQILEKKAGFSANYLGLLVKFQGDERIDFLAHRIDGFLHLRTFFFPIGGNRLEVGLKFGYQYFVLDNQKSEGAYYYRSLFGPAIGLFLDDPVFYRMFNDSMFRNMGMESSLTFCYVTGLEDTPLGVTFYAGIYYDYSSLRFSFGYELYQVFSKTQQDQYNMIHLGAAYGFK